LLRAPVAADASRSWRTIRKDEALVAVVHDLFVVCHFLDVGAVIVEAHVAHQENLAVGDRSGIRAVNWKVMFLYSVRVIIGNA
jgi:hypothetical protein